MPPDLGGFQAGREDPGQLHRGGGLEPTGWVAGKGRERGREGRCWAALCLWATPKHLTPHTIRNKYTLVSSLLWLGTLRRGGEGLVPSPSPPLAHAEHEGKSLHRDPVPSAREVWRDWGGPEDPEASAQGRRPVLCVDRSSLGQMC